MGGGMILIMNCKFINTLYISITLMNECFVTPQVTSTVDHPTSCCAGRGFVCVLL